MGLRNVLLTLHILAAIVTVGWLALQSLVVPGLIRRGPASAGAVRFSATVSQKVGPATTVVFLLGIWLVLRAKDDGADFDDMWVSLSMLIFIVTAVLGGVLGGKAEKAAAEKLEAGQPATEEASRLAAVGLVNLLLLVAIVWLMVDKPGISS